MLSLSDDLFMMLCTYLDLETVLALSIVCKDYQRILKGNTFWALKKNLKSKPQGLTSGAYFKYNFKSYWSQLNTKEHITFDLKSYKSIIERVSHPRSLVKSSIESQINQSLNGMLKYEDDLFWNSKLKKENDSNEVIICELIEDSFVFSVHFKVYKALCHGGILFPPKSIRISIGSSPEDYHYTSEIFKVPMSERYTTIQILPEIVIGRFIMIELLGKVTPMPDSGLYFTALEFFDVIGHPCIEVPETNLDQAIRHKNLSIVMDILERNKHKSTPFIVDFMEREGIINEVLSSLQRELNEAESFIYLKSRVHANVNMEKLKSSEALGDLCFESGAFDKAFYIYKKNMDIWKLTKTAIVIKHTATLKYIISLREPRYPRYFDIKKIAKSLGAEFEEFIKSNL